jgi:type IV pilus assembly protein PilA
MLKSMLQSLRDAQGTELEAEGAGEAGFTLIELMVVLLIIAILLAIAIPTFLGVTKGANDRAAQSNLTNAMTEASAVYQNSNQAYPAPSATFSSANTDAYQTSAPEFLWASIASAGANSQNEISVDSFAVANAADGQGVALAVLSKTGTCWYIINLQQAPGASNASHQSGAGTFYGKNTAPTSCVASNALAAAVTGTSYSTASTVAG